MSRTTVGRELDPPQIEIGVGDLVLIANEVQSRQWGEARQVTMKNVDGELRLDGHDGTGGMFSIKMKSLEIALIRRVPQKQPPFQTLRVVRARRQY